MLATSPMVTISVLLNTFIGIDLISSNVLKFSSDFTNICCESLLIVPIGFLLSAELKRFESSLKEIPMFDNLLLSTSIRISSLAPPKVNAFSVPASNANFCFKSVATLVIKILGASPRPFQTIPYNNVVGGPLLLINSTFDSIGSKGNDWSILSWTSDQTSSIKAGSTSCFISTSEVL